jgi:hypothetical protein
VRLLALTHASPRHTGRELLEEAAATFPRVVHPRDFDTIDVPFAEKGEPVLLRWDRATHAPEAAEAAAARAAAPGP